MRANVLFSAPGAYKGQCIFSFHKTEKNKSLNYWKIGVKIKNYIVPKTWEESVACVIKIVKIPNLLAFFGC